MQNKETEQEKQRETENTACSQQEMLQERFELASARIIELAENCGLQEKAQKDFFQTQFAFAKQCLDDYTWVRDGGLQTDAVADLAMRNKAIYADILPEHYEESYCNPTYAAGRLGVFGQLLCCAAAEMRAMIPAVYEQRMEEVVIRLELLLELFGCFATARQEEIQPEVKDIHEILYWYFSDYAEMAAARRVAQMVNPVYDFFTDIVRNANLEEERYLYLTGEYVTDNERELVTYLNHLPQEKIDLIASTYTEGYRMGFVMTQKDLSKKKTVEIIYRLGFERIVRKAIENFAAMGLKPTIFRAAVSLLENKQLRRREFYGAVPNQQFDFDHKEDLGLFLDKNLLQRKLESLQAAYEAEKENAGTYAGPAVIETFGEPNFTPEEADAAVKYSENQQQDMVTYASKAGEITNRYIHGEERSFTIIAFPVPAIAQPGSGVNFAEIFDETIRINTLDYQLYSRIQQKIIDVLDEAAYVIIRGMGKNRTNMRVMLHNLSDRVHQTNFENCVADVNIPVGEVFTSPVLQGTEGRLHVTNVFLEGLHYENLELNFEDGMIKDYTCTNYESEEQNKKFIRDNILFHHETLPIGEFAIGTNTTAFVAARKLQIMGKLPILIAEKTGPHFAVGDTCYSHEEDVKSYNPDGKEIVAKENEKSMCRKDKPEQAYFNCHTDITIPYDELGEISIVKPDNSVMTIFEEGRFILQGCEELNKPFAQL